MGPQESEVLLAGPSVLSEPRINTAGERGNWACKQPFGQESKPTVQFHHHFLWTVIPPLVAGRFCASLSILLGIQSLEILPDQTVAPGAEQASETH